MGGRKCHEEIETENKTITIYTGEVHNYDQFLLFLFIRSTDYADSNNLFVHIAIKSTETGRRRCKGSYGYFMCDLPLW